MAALFRRAAHDLMAATTPTQDAYDAACKALHHWRAEAARLALLAGIEPRQMDCGPARAGPYDDEIDSR